MIAIDWNRGEGEYRSYAAPASPPMTGRTTRSVVPDDFEGRVLHSVEYCIRLLELGWIKIFRDFFVFFFCSKEIKVIYIYICTVFTVCNGRSLLQIVVIGEERGFDSC